jgi:ATP-dependent helicase IRC3
MRSQVYRYISSRFIVNSCLQLSIRRVHNLRQANTGTLSAETALQLRDYQENCIEACLNALERGVTRIGVSMPTGSGKTTVFVSLLHKIPLNETRPAAKNTLIIVNSIELATQAANQVKRMFPETTVEIEQGKNNASGLADV